MNRIGHFIQRDKNKELEAKNRDGMEKLREERAQREAAEAKVRDLTRRMKEIKFESDSKKLSGAGEDAPNRLKSNSVGASSAAVKKTGTSIAPEQPKKEESFPPASVPGEPPARTRSAEVLPPPSGSLGAMPPKSTSAAGQPAPPTSSQPLPMVARSTSTPAKPIDQAPPTRVAGQSMPALSVGNTAGLPPKSVQPVQTATETSSTASARGPNGAKPPLKSAPLPVTAAVESSAAPSHKRQHSASATLVSTAPPKSRPVPMMNIPPRSDAVLTREASISSGQGAVPTAARNGDDKSTSGNSRTNSFGGQEIEGQNSSSPGREAAQAHVAPQNEVAAKSHFHARDGSGESFKLSGTRVPSASDFDPLRPASVAPSSSPGDTPQVVSIPSSGSLPQSTAAVDQSMMHANIQASDPTGVMNQNPQVLRTGMGMAPVVGNSSVIEGQHATMVQTQPTQRMDPGVGPVAFQQQVPFNGVSEYEQQQVMANGYQGLQQQPMTMVPQQQQQQQAQMMGQQLPGATHMLGNMPQMQVGAQQMAPGFPVGFVQVPQGMSMMQNGVQQAPNMGMQNGVQPASNMAMQNSVQQAPNMGMQNGVQQAPNMAMQNGVQHAPSMGIQNAPMVVQNGMQQAPGMGMQNVAQQAPSMMWNGQPGGGSGQWVKQPIVQQQPPLDVVGNNGSLHQRQGSFDPSGGEQGADPFDDFLTLRSKK